MGWTLAECSTKFCSRATRDNEKILGLTIDRNLNFDDHVFSLCKKAGRKLSALSRISNYMSFEKKEFF